MSAAHDILPQSCIDEDYREHYEDSDPWEDQEERDDERFVLACDDPLCLMPGPHFLSECYTLEMAEAWANQFKKTPRLRRVRQRRQ